MSSAEVKRDVAGCVEKMGPIDLFPALLAYPSPLAFDLGHAAARPVQPFILITFCIFRVRLARKCWRGSDRVAHRAPLPLRV